MILKLTSERRQSRRFSLSVYRLSHREKTLILGKGRSHSLDRVKCTEFMMTDETE